MRGRPDTELVVLARAGSADAAAALFDRYWVLAWRTTYAVTADRVVADDAAQEAFVKALSALERFDETQPFAPWLKRIAINAAVGSPARRARRSAPAPQSTAASKAAAGRSCRSSRCSPRFRSASWSSGGMRESG